MRSSIIHLTFLGWICVSASEPSSWKENERKLAPTRQLMKHFKMKKTKKKDDGDSQTFQKGCGGNERSKFGTFELIAKCPKFDSFENALSLTGLDSFIQEQGPFTVFAPTDAAFLQIAKEGVMERLVKDEFIDHLTDLVLHHIIPHEEMCLGDIRNHAWLRLANLERARARITRRGRMSIRPSPNDYDWSETNQLSIVDPDIPAKNGVIHAINRVFLTRWIFQNLYASLVYNDFSAFAEMISNADLERVLESEDSLLTLLVPSNAELLSTQPDTMACIENNPGILEDLIRYHILEGVHSTSTLSEGTNVFTSIYNQEQLVLEVNLASRVSVNGQAEITEANTLAYNGVIHTIDSILEFPGFPCGGSGSVPTSSPVMPTIGPTAMGSLPGKGCDHLPRPMEDIFELVQLDKRLDTMEGALSSAFVDVSASSGTFTLFAPTDAAFMQIDPTKPGILTRVLRPDFVFHLTNMLEHHIVGGEELCIDDLYHGQRLHLYNGDQARVKIGKKGVKLHPFPDDYRFSPTNQLGIVFEDQAASNGVIHLINRVFLTDWIYMTLFDVVHEREAYTTLTTLLITAGLEEFLRDDDDTVVTLLAPINEAFEIVDEPTMTCLVNNIPQLTSLLSYHAIPLVVHTRLVADGEKMDFATVQGSSVTLSSDGETVTINGAARIIQPDSLAFNGLVHGIDAVLNLSSAVCLTT